jgi:hypothetical protein
VNCDGADFLALSYWGHLHSLMPAGQIKDEIREKIRIVSEMSMPEKNLPKDNRLFNN